MTKHVKIDTWDSVGQASQKARESGPYFPTPKISDAGEGYVILTACRPYDAGVVLVLIILMIVSAVAWSVGGWIFLLPLLVAFLAYSLTHSNKKTAIVVTPNLDMASTRKVTVTIASNYHMNRASIHELRQYFGGA